MATTIDGSLGVIPAYDYQVPVAGFSYTLINTNSIFNPAGLLATGTIIMPASPTDGATVKFSSSQAITSLTCSANTGQSIVNAITTFVAGGFASYLYRAANNAWYRIG